MCINTNRLVDNSDLAKAIIDNLTCNICLGIFCLDSLVDSKGHVFCKNCIVPWLQSSKQCPVGKENLEIFNLNPIAFPFKNFLADITLRCAYHEYGCTNAMKYANIIEHEKYCQFRLNNLSVIRSIRSFDAPRSKNLKYMFALEKRNKVIITDNEHSGIKIFDFDANTFETHNPNSLLNKPLAICVNRLNELFVGDTVHKKIFVFSLDNKLKLLKVFDNPIINSPTCMTIDDENNENILYVTDWANNMVTIWNSYTTDFIYNFNLDSPANIKLNKEKIFILSSIMYDMDHEDKTLKSIRKGTNNILVFNKCSFELINKIEFHNWINPRGLYIDENLNLLTIASEMTRNQTFNDAKFLFIINQNNGELMKKIQLNGVKSGINDMVFVNNNKFITCFRDNIQIVELD